jgi:transposase
LSALRLGQLDHLCFPLLLQDSNTKMLSELKTDFERLRPQLAHEAQLLFSMMFRLIEVLILSLPKKKATSSNSGLPPSQDPHRPKKKRSGSGKKPGGQNGHAGSFLPMVPNPNQIIKHPALACNNCDSNLSEVEVDSISRHQVIDIQFTKHIIEHQVEHKTCSCGHHQCHSTAGAPVKYGAGPMATTVELNQVQCVPFKRCAEFFQQKFNLSLSPATLVSFAKQASLRLKLWEEDAKADLLSSSALHADETGINVNTKTWWVHVLSNEKTTLMIPHKRRGTEGMIESEILPYFHGILSHDFWSCYSSFDAIHAPCHSHLQRELERVQEEYGQKWAKKLAGLLLDANEKRESQEGGLTYEQIRFYESEYSRLIGLAKKLNPVNKDRTNQRGRIKQEYPRRLLNRLIEYRDWVLIFLYDPLVPFTNNQAERDIRMLKVQQKVSGYFKTEEGARDYCRIRSYILTMQKRGVSKHDALTQLFAGT